MDDHLLSLENFKLPPKTSQNSVDIQWLSPIDTFTSNDHSNEDRICYQFDGSASLRFFTCHPETSGNDLRQYFLEDLFRSMLIRLNLVLINTESNNSESSSTTKLILPRRVYINRPVFISGYQLVHEPLSMVIDSLQENFKISSVMEEDLEVAEEFPPEITSEERVKQFNTTVNQTDQQRPIQTNRNIYQDLLRWIEQSLGTGNAILGGLILAILVALVGIMIKLFT